MSMVEIVNVVLGGTLGYSLAAGIGTVIERWKKEMEEQWEKQG